jgi:hypothetical protein
MKLICYLKDRQPFDIRSAPMQRDWMENSIDRFAYRCLPLNIGNSHGWEVCCEETFEATWNGGKDIKDITVEAGKPGISHFGSGVLTFHVPCVFRTEPGWNLMVMGPPNSPKRGIQALTGIIETDWAPYSFTMNWIFTEPNFPVKFLKGEPICFFFPIPRGAVDNVQPSFRDMKSDPVLEQQYTEWLKSRHNFIQDLNNPNSEAYKDKWQRRYFQGQQMEGQAAIPDHQTRIRPKPFKDETKLSFSSSQENLTEENKKICEHAKENKKICEHAK